MEELREKPREIHVDKEKKSLLKKLKIFYESNYKLLLIIPFFILAFSLISIGIKYASTGDFINRDVSLKGGVTLTITSQDKLDPDNIESQLRANFPGNDVEVRSLTQFGTQAGIIILIDIEEDQLDNLLDKTEEITNMKLTSENYTVEIVGSSLGLSFFKEVIRALLIAFLVMGAVVFLYFGPDLKFKALAVTLALISGTLIFINKGIILDIIAYLIAIGLIYIFIRFSIPSLAVILAAFSDIIVTLTIVNFLGIKLSTAGIAALLMLIGYSVDTNLLLSIRVLKRKEGTLIDRVFGAMKTGLTMTVTTLVAVIVAFFFTQSEVIKQIMMILMIGLIIDLINTWLQNVGILRFYLEKVKKIR